MFKIHCQRCKEKISKSFDFCPYCGEMVRKKKDGLLDEIDSFAIEENSFDKASRDIEKSFGLDFISQFPFKHIIKELSKDIEKQFKEIDKASAQNKGAKKEIMRKGDIEIKRTVFPGGLSIQINMGSPAKLRLTDKHEARTEFKPVRRELSQEEQERIARLPRKEPEARVRRFSDKVVYEIDMNDIKSLDNVLINKLSNSIEIRAFSDNRAYFKLIPVALPIERYYLKEGKLIVELKPEA